jgi:hypothetical protein
MRTLLGLLELEIRSEEASPGARGRVVTEPLPEIAAPTAMAIRRGGGDGSVAGKGEVVGRRQFEAEAKLRESGGYGVPTKGEKARRGAAARL